MPHQKPSLFLALAVTVLLLASCDSFLDRNPISDADTNDFYRDAGDIERAVNGAYSTLRDVYSDLWIFGDLRSDISTQEELPTSRTNTFIEIFELNPANPALGETWSDHYQTIARANVVLNRMEGLEIDPSRAEQYRGEALFLRSLMYFNLVRIFGDVPLILEEIASVERAFQSTDRTRNPASAVYDQITGDLEEAAQLLPASYEGDDQGRATSGAANALLGKVYLRREAFAEATEVLGSVVESGQYQLLEDYASVFENENALHDEAVFTALYKANGLGHGSPFTQIFTRLEYSNEVAITANTRNIPTTSLLRAYTPDDDERRDVTVVTEFENVATGDTVSFRFNRKYFSINPFPGEGDDDWPVLRYAGVLLMHAEALAEVNGGPTPAAYEGINQVRERAGLEPLPSGLSQNEFLDAVHRERMIELAFEGKRWFDLVRTGRAIEVMANAEPSRDIEEYQLLFPIPQAQIDVSGGTLEQNPGY